MSRIVSFARDELGLALTPAQSEMLSTFEASGCHQAVWQCGRRGGKSLLADVLALYDVAVRDQLREELRAGEPRIAAIVAPRIEQAQHISSCASLIENSSQLGRLLVSQTTEELAFANGSSIRAYPCSARTIRGGAWSSCILDEFAHFVDSTDGPQAGDRVLEAALPALAQFGDSGWLVAISTPRWRSGAFWRLVERAQSGAFAWMHYRHLSTEAMNPRIPVEWLAERRREDPELFAREFLAEFVDGASAYLTSADDMGCVRRGESLIQPPVEGARYVAAMDPAYSLDNFALAIGHKDHGPVVIDGVWTWRRHGHEATLDAVAELARAYHVGRLRTDQHAAQPIREGLAQRGLEADYRPWTSESKSDAFSRLKVALNTRQVELPEDSALIEELCSLEARPTPAGFTKIAAAAGGHDDRAIVVAAVVQELLGRKPTAIVAPIVMPNSAKPWLTVPDALARF